MKLSNALIAFVAAAVPAAAFVPHHTSTANTFGLSSATAKASSSSLQMVAAEIVNGETKPRRTREVSLE